MYYYIILRLLSSPWNVASWLHLQLPHEDFMCHCQVWCSDMSSLCGSWSVALHIHKVHMW